MPKVQADGLPLPQRYGAILTIVIGISMAVLDGAIANVALPTIATDLHATPASSIWVVNAYQIAIVISLLSFSFLGDMFGYRRIYKCGCIDSLEVRKKPGGHWIIRDLMGLDLVGLASL